MVPSACSLMPAIQSHSSPERNRTARIVSSNWIVMVSFLSVVMGEPVLEGDEAHQDDPHEPGERAGHRRGEDAAEDGAEDALGVHGSGLSRRTARASSVQPSRASSPSRSPAGLSWKQRPSASTSTGTVWPTCNMASLVTS